MGLRPFFSFFGSKYRLAPLYPAPRYERLVEPFAGSAGYALLYPDRQVVLNDRDPVVAGLWRYLVAVSEDEILSLPDCPRGTRVDDLPIAQGAKWLIGFWITESQTAPSRNHYSPTRDGSWSRRKRELIASQLSAIRHWVVQSLPYDEMPDLQATWFVDPPYAGQGAGRRYRYNKIDYAALGQWCRARRGNVIVCEREPADWLPFVTLREARNASNVSYTETMWTSE